MADKFLNETGIATIRDWANGKFALDSDLDALDTKVDGIIAEGGEPNVIETVKVNGTALTPDAQKAVDVPVPTVTMTGYQHMTVMPAGENSGFNFVQNENGMMVTTESGSTQLASTGYVDANGGKIDKIKVNGTEQTITNKEVDITIPTLDVRSNPAGGSGTETTYTISQDSDSVSFNYTEQSGTLSDYLNMNLGSDLFQVATINYVNANGGKIDTISVNGTQQTITNKNVDITVPTKVSDVTNDSNFQTDTQVASTISTSLANSGNPYQTQTDVASAISQAVTSAYIYKGSVATVQDLPATGQTVGDVYDVQATGVNYAWNGTVWDALGSYVDTSVLWTSQPGQSNTLVAMTVAEINTILNA